MVFLLPVFQVMNCIIYCREGAGFYHQRRVFPVHITKLTHSKKKKKSADSERIWELEWSSSTSCNQRTTPTRQEEKSLSGQTGWDAALFTLSIYVTAKQAGRRHVDRKGRHWHRLLIWFICCLNDCSTNQLQSCSQRQTTQIQFR